MSGTIDLRGGVIGSSCYVGGNLVAKNCTATLPEVTMLTAELKAMGTIELPLPGLIETMELAITILGADLGLKKLCRAESLDLELRWAQNVQKNDGTTEVSACKAFFRAIPKVIPGLQVEVAEVSENELTFAPTRYELIIDGERVLLIDQLNDIFEVDGKDYNEALRNAL